MAVSSDLLQAKQVMSSRLLRAGLAAGITSRRAERSVVAAVATAGSNVHAVGIGMKLVEGQPTATPAVRIYVVQKIAPSLLPPRDRLPEFIDGIPTDIIESSPAFLSAQRREREAAPTCSENRLKRIRPLVAGLSTAHRDVTAGTLGYFCRSLRHGDHPTQVFVLSNNHVYANLNLARPGDAIFQPGPVDGAIDADHIADFHRSVRLILGGVQPNRVDAAIGALLPGVAFLPEVCSIGSITGIAQAEEGMLVRKHGRTTGFTEGTVTDESYDALVGMDHRNPDVVALFTNQMRIDRVNPFPAFAKEGDSGSLVVMKTEPRAMGLYFAGPPDGNYGVANHLSDVMSELEIELV